MQNPSASVGGLLFLAKAMGAKESFIGIFDSGVGGLTVLHEARKRMPHHSFLYFADRQHAPYGEGSKSKTQQLTLNCVQFMTQYGLDALVLACNTATSVAVKELRRLYDFPVIGMEPALKPAVEHGTGKVLVLATPLTLQEEKFRKLVQQLDQQGKVDGIGMPDLVRFAEQGLWSGAKVADYFKQQLRDVRWQEYSTIVLGCTHFIYFKEALRALLPPHIAIIDGNQGTVNRLMDQLKEPVEDLPRYRYFDSRKEVDAGYFSTWLTYLKSHD